MDGVFQERAELKGNGKRVSLTLVQLASYFTGFSEIYEVKGRGKKKKWGQNLTLRSFMRNFLSYGSAL